MKFHSSLARLKIERYVVQKYIHTRPSGWIELFENSQSSTSKCQTYGKEYIYAAQEGWDSSSAFFSHLNFQLAGRVLKAFINHTGEWILHHFNAICSIIIIINVQKTFEFTLISKPLWLWLLPWHLVQLGMIMGRQIVLRWKFTWKSLKLPLSSSRWLRSVRHKGISKFFPNSISTVLAEEIVEQIQLEISNFSLDWLPKKMRIVCTSKLTTCSWWLSFPFSLHKCPAQRESEWVGNVPHSTSHMIALVSTIIYFSSSPVIYQQK